MIYLQTSPIENTFMIYLFNVLCIWIDFFACLICREGIQNYQYVFVSCRIYLIIKQICFLILIYWILNSFFSFFVLICWIFVLIFGALNSRNADRKQMCFYCVLSTIYQDRNMYLQVLLNNNFTSICVFLLSDCCLLVEM